MRTPKPCGVISFANDRVERWGIMPPSLSSGVVQILGVLAYVLAWHTPLFFHVPFSISGRPNGTSFIFVKWEFAPKKFSRAVLWYSETLSAFSLESALNFFIAKLLFVNFLFLSLRSFSL